MAGTEIRTLDEFLIHLGKVKEGQASWEEIILMPGSVIVPVKTTGPEEDYRVDARSATLIRNIQNRADYLFKKYTANSEKAPLIKVASKQGSNLLDFDLTAVVISAIQRMASQDVSMVLSLFVGGALGLGALYLWFRHRDHVSDNKTREREHERTTGLIEKALEVNREVATAALGHSNKVASPLREYVNLLDDSASVSVADFPPLSKDEVKRALVAKRVYNPIYIVGCDGVFELLGIGVEKMPPTLKISQNGISVTASIQNLDIEVQNFLVEKVKSCLSEGTLPQSIELQVDVSFNKKGLRYASVVGVGTPRPGMDKYTFADIPNEVNLNDAMRV